MARYLTQHTLACLTRQGAAELARQIAAASEVSARRSAFNLVEGKMLVEFEAADRETLERWLALEKIHFDWILRLEWEFAAGEMRPL
jgi:hypothetical protein